MDEIYAEEEMEEGDRTVDCLQSMLEDAVRNQVRDEVIEVRKLLIQQSPESVEALLDPDQNPQPSFNTPNFNNGTLTKEQFDSKTPTYAQITQRPPKRIRTNTPPETDQPDCHFSIDNTETTTPKLTPRQTETQRRTQILRRLPPDTTPTDIIDALTEQFDLRSPAETIQSVIRDEDDRRRFYITYKTMDKKRECAGKGFTVRNVKIPPCEGDLPGLLPYLPYYIDQNDVDSELKRYGTILRGHFRTDKHGIRTGGYTFDLQLHPGQTPPTELTFYGKTYHIINRDDKRYCSHCHRYGHTRNFCRTRQNIRTQPIYHDRDRPVEEQPVSLNTTTTEPKANTELTRSISKLPITEVTNQDKESSGTTNQSIENTTEPETPQITNTTNIDKNTTDELNPTDKNSPTVHDSKAEKGVKAPPMEISGPSRLHVPHKTQNPDNDRIITDNNSDSDESTSSKSSTDTTIENLKEHTTTATSSPSPSSNQANEKETSTSTAPESWGDRMNNEPETAMELTMEIGEETNTTAEKPSDPPPKEATTETTTPSTIKKPAGLPPKTNPKKSTRSTIYQYHENMPHPDFNFTQKSEIVDNTLVIYLIFAIPPQFKDNDEHSADVIDIIDKHVSKYLQHITDWSFQTQKNKGRIVLYQFERASKEHHIMIEAISHIMDYLDTTFPTWKNVNRWKT